MAIIDWRMEPAWSRTGKNSKTLYYQGLPATQAQCAFAGATDSASYLNHQVGMKPLDTAGYRTAHISMFNVMDTIGYARMDSGYSSGISEGDFLYMRCTGKSRRDLVRVLKVVTDAVHGGASDTTAEPIMILELQVDRMGWPNPSNNGYGDSPESATGGKGYRFDFTAWQQTGTIELVTEDLASGGTAYPVLNIGDSLPSADSAGLGLGNAFSADELKYWQRAGYGGVDMTPYVLSAYPPVHHGHGEPSPMADEDKLGSGNTTTRLDQPGYGYQYEGWAYNYEGGYPRHEYGSAIREMRRLGQSTLPYVYGGDGGVLDENGDSLVWYGRWASPVSGYIENPPEHMIITWQSRGSSNWGKANRAFYHVDFAGQPSDGDTVTITDDSSNTEVFEFDDDTSVTGGNIAVTIGSDAVATGKNLNTAIRAASDDTTFKVYSDDDSGFYGGSSESTGSTDKVKVFALYTGSTTNFAVTESATNVTATKKFDGHDGGGFRPRSVISGTTGSVPGGYNVFPWHCLDMIITLKK